MLHCAIPLRTYAAAQERPCPSPVVPQTWLARIALSRGRVWRWGMGLIPMRATLLMLGLPDIGMPQLIVIMAIATACVFALGWIADAILGDGAFGVAVNALMLIVGATVGIMLWRRFGHGPGVIPPQTLALVATSCGLGTLIGCSVLRRWI